MRLALPLLSFALLSAQAPAPVQMTPVALELFTSQGCSSCPPADALAEKLATEPNIIVLTRPVTYWDRLGWKDTLAREANTQLQRDYAAKGGEAAGVYTPQAMIQGVAAAVGSDEARLRRLIAVEKRRPGPSISARATADGGRTLVVRQDVKADAQISVLALKAQAIVRIGSGENGGRVVRYTNVVLAESMVGRWRGGDGTFSIPGKALKTAGADRYAIILREGSAGRIVAARYI